MKLLAIDPSKHALGYAVFLDGNVLTVGSHSFSQHTTLPAFLKAFKAWYQKHVQDCTHVAYERSKPRSMAHAEQHYGMITVMHLYAHGRPVEAVNWATAKKTLTGSGNASKTDMLTAARDQYPFLHIATHDQADAIAVGLVALAVTPDERMERVNALEEEYAIAP